MAVPFGRLSPGGSAIPLGCGRRIASPGDAVARLRDGLVARLGDAPLTFHASGREALRALFVGLGAASGRGEILVPGYACYSVAAAAVAAGMRVRLVDVDARGRIDATDLVRQPLDDVAAVVVCNLLGVGEPLAPWRERVESAGVAIVDDAAQSLGARGPEGRVGARGHVGMLSFGRGKPLSALGGGALYWSGGPPALEELPPEPARPAAALARAVAYDVARHPWVFRALSAVPQLGIGETPFEPAFQRGALDGASLCVAAALVDGLEASSQARAAIAAELAGRICAGSRFAPLLAADDATGVFPRLGVRAPDRAARDRALAALQGLGATALYPAPLTDIPGLAPHRADDAVCPGARAFCERLLTLPVHDGMRGARMDAAVAALEEAS